VRPAPTGSHFDPERIDYWTVERGRGVETAVDWSSPVARSDYAWGRIQITDRFGEKNCFATFGGRLEIIAGERVRVAAFSSGAPILALGARSGPPDPLGALVGGFLGAIRGAAGEPELARLLALATPNEIYAAFLDDRLSRRSTDEYDDTSSALLTVLRRERMRVSHQVPREFRRGVD